MTDTEVLIAGGGPAGLVLALELGARGVDCILLNDAPHTARHPKANAVSSRTMEHMRRHGIADRLRLRRFAVRRYFWKKNSRRKPTRCQVLICVSAGN